MVVAGWAAISRADDPPDLGPNMVAQSAADILRSYAGADAAFIHAGFFKSSLNRDDLASDVKYPVDGIAVMKLTGQQIRDALEFAASLYPESNYGFLQLSGIDVIVKKGAVAEHRIGSVTINGANLDNGHTYSVAMPSLLARGAVGYVTYWGKEKPAKEFGATTMEDILKGKKATEGSPRWVIQG